MEMYFIALIAPEKINQRVLKWKLWMQEKFQCQAALKSPAHITLIPPFWMQPELENELHHSIDEFSVTQNPISIQLNGFSCFKPKVLYVNVEINEALNNLKDLLEQFLIQKEKFRLSREDRSFQPHVTIATRDLHKKAFYEAWDHFKKINYSAEWIADGISVLKHNKKNWDVLFTSQFQSV
ncbi:MAG TPA: 2'-5' RNA ligase family protein [Chitinophagaceae bacterium]|jgi:2'-5' RNA ligase|nr:2'-5' RNA ligase family protein [Chitinophagaceae bacterium]